MSDRDRPRRDLLGSHLRERRRSGDDLEPPRPPSSPGKLTTRELRDYPHLIDQLAIEPGKVTYEDVGRPTMAPAQALRYASQSIHRDAEPGRGELEEDHGLLASAFSWIAASRAGARLPAKLAAQLTRQLGLDVSRIRIHTDAAAAQAAAALGARAFTQGDDIYFAEGAFRPDRPDGVRLIAHEVAHVAQGSRGVTGPSDRTVSRPGDAHERDADTFAARFTDAEPAVARVDRRAERDPAPDAGRAIGEVRGDGGSRLPEALMRELSDELGHDVGDVRIHTGARAAFACEMLGASAFAIGNDVYFASGQYDPDSGAGRRLIAHEVAHTVQQRHAPSTGKLEVSEPGDAHEVEAEAFAEGFAGRRKPAADDVPARPDEPAAAPSRIVAPRSFPMVSMVNRRIVQLDRSKAGSPWPAMFEDPATYHYRLPTKTFFPMTEAFSKKWDPIPTMVTPLASGSFLIDFVPVHYNLKHTVGSTASAALVFGPGTLNGGIVYVTGAEADRQRERGGWSVVPNPFFPVGPIIVPVPNSDPGAPRGQFSASAMLKFGTYAYAKAAFETELRGQVGVFGNVFNVQPFFGISASAGANAGVDFNGFANFKYDNGAVSANLGFDVDANAGLDFKVAPYAGIAVELKFPEIPVVSDLINAVRGWPLIGWIPVAIDKLKWKREYRKEWPIFEKHYKWHIEKHLGIAAGAGTGALTNPKGFDFTSLIADLMATQKPGEMMDDPAGPGKDKRLGSPGDIAGARARASAQISSAKRAVVREQKHNDIRLKEVKKKKAAAAAAAGPSTAAAPPIAIGGGGDPENALVKRGEELEKADAATDELKKTSTALEKPAAAEDGPSRNQAQAGMNTVADNADKLGDKVDKNEGPYAMPPGTEPVEPGYEAMIAAKRAAYDVFDQAFDATLTEDNWASKLARELSGNADLAAYRVEIGKYYSKTDAIWKRVDKIGKDLETAAEWYERGDFGLGKVVFDEQKVKAQTALNDINAVIPTRPKEDWDTSHAELVNGKLVLQKTYKDVRHHFYPHDYRKSAKDTAYGALKYLTRPDGEYWQYRAKMSDRGDYWWKVVDPQERPTLEHDNPTVAVHWRRWGRRRDQPTRNDFYNFEGKATITVLPKYLNSSEGQTKNDDYEQEVFRSFTG